MTIIVFNSHMSHEDSDDAGDESVCAGGLSWCSSAPLLMVTRSALGLSLQHQLSNTSNHWNRTFHTLYTERGNLKRATFILGAKQTTYSEKATLTYYIIHIIKMKLNRLLLTLVIK